jgi:hypothetical protein
MSEGRGRGKEVGNDDENDKGVGKATGERKKRDAPNALWENCDTRHGNGRGEFEVEEE